MGLKIWLGDGLVDESQAKISVFDHGLLYGDGVFEGLRVYNGRVFKLQEHLERLYEGAGAIRLKIPVNIETMTDRVLQTVAANDFENAYIRLIVTRGRGLMGLNPFNCEEAQVIIIVTNLQMYPEEHYENGIKVISSSVLRNHPLSLPPQVKSLNYLNNIMAKIEAMDAGVSEAIMYNHSGYVAEASADNLFIVKRGVIYVPPVQAGSLDGITRRVLIKIAGESGIKVVEQNLTKFDLYTCDELFLSGTGAEVIGVVEIDGRAIGNGACGPVTTKLRKLFYEYVRRAE